MNFTKNLIVLCVLVLITGCQSAQQNNEQTKYSYPSAKTTDIVDIYHGTKIPDPYRWLEDPNSQETTEWVEAQNKLTKSFINPETKEKIRARLTELWNYPRYTSPMKRGSRYFFTKNDGLKNQPIVYMQKGIDGPSTPIIDPNTLSEDGTAALSTIEPSKDGSLIAYGISYKGSDWQEIKILNTDSAQHHPETIKWCKFATIAWLADNSGFYYDRFPDPASASKEQQKINRVYFHQVGTDPSKDKLVFEHPDSEKFPHVNLSPFITSDEKYLVLWVGLGLGSWNTNRVYYKELKSGQEFIHLINHDEPEYLFLGNIGTTFYLKTTLKAPRGRIIAIDINDPAESKWKEIIPQVEDTINSVIMANNKFSIVYNHHAHNIMKIYNPDGNLGKEVKMPTICSIDTLSSSPNDTELFFKFDSFLSPPSIYRYDFTKDQLTVFMEPSIKFDSSKYEANQIFYTSKDGTKIPMFLIHKKGLKLNGTNPTLLYGYGGFNVSLTPYFSNSRLVWLENGGVFALANIRGGSEYGEAWHQAGILDKKQNVFDDFIAAAEWLISNKYTNSKKIAILGGSNGGLLVAACMTQRPELFGAVICMVPVIDMLRYHKFTVGYYWIPEYGNAEEKPEHFQFLVKYSPLHNVKKETTYPPTLVITADTDDRVVPSHAKKFAATLQANDNGTNPILVRIETKAGHGGGKPTTKVIDEFSDVYAFLFKVFGVK
ncbi:MAG: S9 family peptidase [Planctomycetes bacterium]|nr:S9 family peptidase [Planctomycetota bacterium]